MNSEDHMAKACILVVEDDPDILELVGFNLGREGWQVLKAESGEAGIQILKNAHVDLILLDIMLPNLDGIEVLKRLKADPRTAAVPVILATAKGEDHDVVVGLELGADDYVVKPYSPRVLVARIKKRLGGHADAGTRLPDGPAGSRGSGQILECSPFRLDIGRHEAKAGGQALDLSATEFALMELFLAHPGIVFSRSQIIEAVRGSDYPVTDRAVDVQILGLRKKLGDHGDLVETIRGVGYRLKDPAP
jgi:two-component system phosphate regulon response regulator PhoB